MRENLYDEENRMFEKFEIQQDNKPFIENKCPINLNEHKYIKLEYNFGGKKNQVPKISYLLKFAIYSILEFLKYFL